MQVFNIFHAKKYSMKLLGMGLGMRLIILIFSVKELNLFTYSCIEGWSASYRCHKI